MDNKLTNHLVYFDVTDECNLTCKICMYKDKHTDVPLHLKLNDYSRKNVSNIINHDDTGLVVLSGEGEPSKNFDCINEILDLSTGNNSFQIITNGGWDVAIQDYLSTLEQKSLDKNDYYSIRLSIDPFHISQIDMRNYVDFFKYHLNSNSNKVSIAVRGLLEYKNATRTHIYKILSTIDNSPLILSSLTSIKCTDPYTKSNSFDKMIFFINSSCKGE